MNKSFPTIRPLTENDIDVAANIAAQCMEYAWSAAVFCDCLKAQYHAWLLTFEKPIGFLVLHDKISDCEMMNIGVLPEYQRQGYGQQLLAHAMAYAEANHFSHLCLEVRASNKAAISLYHAAGFIDVGLRKNYYPKGREREDAVLMTLGLNGPQ